VVFNDEKNFYEPTSALTKDFEKPLILTSNCHLGERGITTYCNVLGLMRPCLSRARTHSLLLRGENTTTDKPDCRIQTTILPPQITENKIKLRKTSLIINALILYTDIH
jgi:hypothetical protein